MKKSTVLQMLFINAYWVGVSFMWNSLHPIVLPAILVTRVPEGQKNTWLGLLTFTGLIIAMFIQPITGAFSDQLASRWGRRRPFIVLGTLFDLVFLAILGWAGGAIWLVVGYIGLQITSNIAHGPMQGLLPDRVPPGQFGMASSIKNLLDMSGLIVATLLSGRLIDGETTRPVAITLVIMGVLILSMITTVFGTPEEPTYRRADVGKAKFNPLAFLAGIDFKSHRAFWQLIGSRLAFLIGIYGIETFLQYYLRDVFKAANPAQQTGDLMAVIAISLIALTLAGGWLCDRFGAKRILYAAGFLGMAGSLLLLTARTFFGLVIFGNILGAGIGLFLTANWALVTRLAPPAEAGKFLGLTNIATAGAGALGRLEGPMIDLLNGVMPGAYLGYYSLFILGALGSLISILLLTKVKEPDNPGQTTREEPAVIT